MNNVISREAVCPQDYHGGTGNRWDRDEISYGKSVDYDGATFTANAPSFIEVKHIISEVSDRFNEDIPNREYVFRWEYTPEQGWHRASK